MDGLERVGLLRKIVTMIVIAIMSTVFITFYKGIGIESIPKGFNEIVNKMLIPMIKTIGKFTLFGFIIIPPIIFIVTLIDERLANKKKKEISHYEEKLANRKLKKNDGYKAAKYLSTLTNYLKGEIDNFTKKEKELLSKCEDILEMYFADTDEFAFAMYKYEETFKIATNTVEKFIMSKSHSNKDEKLMSLIHDLINIPYNEIVKQKGEKWLYESGKSELQILKEINDINEGD